MSRIAVVACFCALVIVGGETLLDIEECVRYGLEHSREIGRRRLAYEGQRFTTLVRRGKFRPVLSAELTHTVDPEDTRASVSVREELPAGFSLLGAVRATDSGTGMDSAEASFRVSKVLLGGGSYAESMLEIDNSLIDEMIQLNLLRKYQRELAFQVRRDYYRTIRNTMTLRINEMRVERSKKNLEHAEERMRPLDIANARIEVPDNESAVLRALREIDSALDELKSLIGMDVAEELRIHTDFAFEIRPLDVPADIAFAQENHEDILNEMLRRRKIVNEIRVQRARNWPKVSVHGEASRDSEAGRDLRGDTDASVGMALSWEIGSVTERNRHSKLLNDLESKDIDIADAHQQRARSIRDLARRLEETLRQIELQERKIEVGAFRAGLYRDRWENGEIDILEYIRSQNDLENSRIQQINSRTTYMELLGEYDFAVGR
ncbi:MAG: TolC family protein [Lentisphaeria bacterium]|nr:TolC family protein [Lentisphaeria bacterium]